MLVRNNFKMENNLQSTILKFQILAAVKLKQQRERAKSVSNLMKSLDFQL